MIKTRGHSVRWSESDAFKMESLVGADTAASRNAPLIPAIVRGAEIKKLRLHESAHAFMKRERHARRELLPLQTALEAPVEHAYERDAFAHQRASLRYYARAMELGYTGLLCADDTGVGKTLQALLWAKYLVRAERTVIITKNGVKDQWHDAIKYWIGKRERVTVVDGSIEEQNRQASTRSGWIVGHWESLVHAIDGYREYGWDVAIADEAHLMGNHKSFRSEAAAKLTKRYAYAATAHPFTNDVGELYAILRFLYPHVHTSYWRHMFLFARMEPAGFGRIEITGVRRPKLLAWELQPFTQQRTKLQVFPSLPRVSMVRRTASLTKRGVMEYEKLKRQFFVELDGFDGPHTVVIPSELPRLTRVRQYLIDPALIGGREKSVKFPLIADIIDEAQQPTVVFSSFREACVNLGAFLTKHHKYKVGYYWGRMSRAKQRDVKQRFLNGKLDALLVVAEAGDTGLNLGGYGYVAHLDLPFTPRGYQQAIGRVDRPEENTGKLVPTTAYRAIVRDSYEERLEQKLERKHGQFGKVFTVKALQELFT